MNLSGWHRIGILLSVVWPLAVVGLAIFEFQSANVFCQFDNTGSVCHQAFWVWAYVGPEKFELALNYGRFAAAMLSPIAVLWGCLASVAWVRQGFRRSS